MLKVTFRNSIFPPRQLNLGHCGPPARQKSLGIIVLTRGFFFFFFFLQKFKGKTCPYLIDNIDNGELNMRRVGYNEVPIRKIDSQG